MEFNQWNEQDRSREDIEETILKEEEDTPYKHRITWQGPLLHDGPKLNSINIYKHTITSYGIQEMNKQQKSSTMHSGQAM